MAGRIAFHGAGDVRWEPLELRSPGPGEVRLRTLVSLMSTGTEGIVLHRKFAPGTHWDTWVKYPFYPGYSAISEIVEAGEGVALPIGQRVATRTSHASGAVVRAGDAIPVPEGVSDESASWFALAKIAFVGARAAEYQLGDSVAVIGAGPIGQMTVRWAAAAGAGPITVFDPVADRLRLAEAGGAHRGLAIDVANATGERPRIVVDTTGHAGVFPHALKLAADFGRVVVLGDTGTPEEQRLTGDVIRRGLSVVGAHDIHLPNTPAIFAPFFDLVQRGRFPLEGMISHTFRGEDAVEAYRLATERRGETMGILFDWR